jgi:hypothetical protein
MYKTPGDGIVGQPQVVEELLVVADQSGKFVGLDLLTGKPAGVGYQLRAKVAPAAAPVPYNTGWAFAPLTDRTVLLLSLAHLRHPLQEFPTLP